MNKTKHTSLIVCMEQDGKRAHWRWVRVALDSKADSPPMKTSAHVLPCASGYYRLGQAC